MTKYTDEQIIAYLKTLREGDVLTAGKEWGVRFSEGGRYTVLQDADCDLFIKTDNGNESYVNIGNEYDCSLSDYFREGVFEIPTQASAEPFELTITQTYPTDVFDDKAFYIVHASVDGEGLARLQALAAESKKAQALTELYAQRDALQAQIDELEGA